MHVGRTTPGRPGGEFPSRRQVAISHARDRARAFLQRRTLMLLYALRIRSRVHVLLPETRHAGWSHRARPTRVRMAQPATSGDLSRSGTACLISQRLMHMLLYAFHIRLRVPVCLPEPRHAGRSQVLGRAGSEFPGRR